MRILTKILFQLTYKKCTENQTRNIIRFAATSTDVRKEKIMDLVDEIEHNQSPTIKGFGISLDTNFVQVNGRLLDAPRIQYANGVTKPTKGVWNKVDIKNQSLKFLLPKTNSKWGIFNVHFKEFEEVNEIDHPQLEDLANMVCSNKKKFGGKWFFLSENVRLLAC